MGVKSDYVTELNSIAARYGSLEDQTIRKMLAMLKAFRSQLAATIATTDWQAFRLDTLRANIDAQIAQFEAQLATELKTSFLQTIDYGIDAVNKPLQKLGVQAAFFRASTAQLNAIVDFSARLVQQIGEDMRGKIDQQVRLGVLGDKNPIDVMKAITQDLGIEARARVWKGRPDPVKGIAARAETIARTEMQRAFNLATHSQQLEQADRIPGLLKTWSATADTRTRQSHLRAHAQYRNSPIPVKEPFIVGGAKLMYPGDPNGPPQETINCRCTSDTIHPAIGRIGSSLDGRIAAELKRRAA